MPVLISVHARCFGVLAILVALMTLMLVGMGGKLYAQEMPNPMPSTSYSETGKIAYTSDSDIYVMSADGSDKRCLTICNENSPFNPSTAPAWSWDDEHIAFKGVRNSPDPWAIFVMDADGANLRKVAEYDSCNVDANFSPPSWSPDDRQIAFAACHDKQWSIHVVDADGENLKRILEIDEAVNTLAWSPDGMRFAFATYSGIAVVGINGDNLQQLVRFGFSPAWSPDGQTLAFTHVGMPPKDGGSIEIIDADGSNLRKVFYGSYIVNSPTWSPDGRSIAFMAQLNIDFQGYFDGSVYRINVDGSDLRELAQFAELPAWSHSSD